MKGEAVAFKSQGPGFEFRLGRGCLRFGVRSATDLPKCKESSRSSREILNSLVVI